MHRGRMQYLLQLLTAKRADGTCISAAGLSTMQLSEVAGYLWLLRVVRQLTSNSYMQVVPVAVHCAEVDRHDATVDGAAHFIRAKVLSGIGIPQRSRPRAYLGTLAL